ncbi:DinB family protein [Psychrobacillus sp. NEAU-3TGS]|uniref:DinB family protein n=1 Tax=Psychrobacillus sp. NEAU-3TGS TaxID=2995412 RepID=UPI002496A3EA|nr:DinB family protein [Psychrobacillus sp. NEAU-3TGS]MDI2585937.1 DinB family protein [Psychrobacillus sp. NEAU-3TGS]
MINDVIKQLKYISKTIEQLFQYVDVEIQHRQPIANKMSVWEICVHLAQIPKADLLILEGYSEEQMTNYYYMNTPVSIDNAKNQFLAGIQELIYLCEKLTKEQLEKNFMTYWKSEYSTAEWLMQIVTHLVHHRSQLYQYLLMLNRDVEIVLFR